MNTNNELMTYTFGESAVRMLLINEQPYFVAKDVCDVLNLTNTSVAIGMLDDDDKQKVDPKLYLGSQSNQDLWIINESGLYSLVLRSNKPEAKTFKKWVTSEVLPSIRKTGGYKKDSAAPPNDDDIILKAHMILTERVNQQQAIIESQIKEITKLLPHATYAINVLESATEWTATNVAKSLGLKSAQELNKILKDMNVHYQMEGVWVLVAKYATKGYTKTRTTEYKDTDGVKKTNMITVWTEKGREFVAKMVEQYYLTSKA